MIIEWKYYFEESSLATDFLNSLIERENNGEFLGFTFLKANTHTCFNEEQCGRVDKLIKELSPEISFQKKAVWRGDLFDVDFGLKTFKQPFVQWCPSPIFSFKTGQLIPPDEPWGVSMEGHVLLKSHLRSTVKNNIVGFRKKAFDLKGSFDSYDIVNRNITKNYQLTPDGPLTLDCTRIEALDIFSLDRDILLCSTRFANILKRDWDGIVQAKFQPVQCHNVSKHLRKRNFNRIIVEKAPDISKDIIELETHIGVKFPVEYVKWLISLSGHLPEGWLSPVGGKKSEISKCLVDEQEMAEPSMPETLTPVFKYGDGNFICIMKDDDKFVHWDHEEGTWSPIEMPHGLERWLAFQSED